MVLFSTAFPTLLRLFFLLDLFVTFGLEAAYFAPLPGSSIYCRQILLSARGDQILVFRSLSVTGESAVTSAQASVHSAFYERVNLKAVVSAPLVSCQLPLMAAGYHIRSV